MLKDLPGGHHLLTQFSLKVPTNGLTLNAISAALFEFTTMAPSITPLQSEVLKALFVALENAIPPHRHQEGEPWTLPHVLTEKMESLIEHQESQVEKLTRISEEIKASIDFSTEALNKATEQACTTLKEAAITSLVTPPTSKPATYADALKNGTPVPHAEVLAASEAQTRQVTIKCEMTDLYNLSERELVLKANIVLENMTSEEDFPTGGRFLSTRKQKGMKICLELNAQEIAEWLRGKKKTKMPSCSFLAQTPLSSPKHTRRW